MWSKREGSVKGEGYVSVYVCDYVCVCTGRVGSKGVVSNIVRDGPSKFEPRPKLYSTFMYIDLEYIFIAND